MMLHKSFGQIIFPSFTNLIWRLENKNKVIYLSFDDGPIPNLTSTILEILTEFQVQAHFFLSGGKIAENVGKLNHLDFSNHRLGNHGYHHFPMILQSKKKIHEEIIETDKLIYHHFGITAKLFRPPYGIVGPGLYKLVNQLNKDLVLWSLMSNDFKWEADRVYSQLVKNLESGDIIVFHNSEKNAEVTVKTLPKFLHFCQKNGYKFNLL